MAEALCNLPQTNNPNLLIGFNKADDAGVYKISDDLALVQTVDFFPPIVDDPYYFGKIAAANALSDIYAMGATPLTALNIVGFPSSKMPNSILGEILRGGTEIIKQAGAVVVGGHSIQDDELKYGVSVTGKIHPDKIISNSNAKPGNKIYLTKSLGTGLITTGIKNKIVSKELEKIVTEQMALLNKDAAEIMIRHNAPSATDITGFGLLGHAYEMAAGSNVTIKIYSEKLPLLPDVLELAEKKMIPGGAIANREFMENRWKTEGKLDINMERLLFDPQTSGGLFIAISEENSDSFENDCKKNNISAFLIGEVLPADDVPIIIV